MAFADDTTPLSLWADNPFLSTEFLVTIGLLIATLLAGAVVLYFTDIWRKKQFSTGHESLESLTHYRALFDRGEITETEYQAIRAKVATRVKQEVTLNKLPLPETTLPLADEPNSAKPTDHPTPPPELPPTP